MKNLICLILFPLAAHLAAAQSAMHDTIEKPDTLKPVYCYIDGIKVRGCSNLPLSGIDEVTVITGGLPGDYSEVSSCFFRFSTGEKDVPSRQEIASTLVDAFRIVPNPASETTIISLTDATFQGGKLTVSSLSGYELFTAVIDGTTETIDVSALSQGVYSVRMQKDERVSMEMLVIE